MNIIKEKLKLFVYWSLLNRLSAKNTLKRDVEIYIPYKLNKTSLAWTSWQKVINRKTKEIYTSASLNINLHSEENIYTQWSFIEVLPEEMARLIIRENGYSLINISDRISLKWYNRSYTFVDLRKPPENTIITKNYYERVINWVKEQWKDFEINYLKTFPTPWKLIEWEFIFFDNLHQSSV